MQPGPVRRFIPLKASPVFKELKEMNILEASNDGGGSGGWAGRQGWKMDSWDASKKACVLAVESEGGTVENDWCDQMFFFSFFASDGHSGQYNAVYPCPHRNPPPDWESHRPFSRFHGLFYLHLQDDCGSVYLYLKSVFGTHLKQRIYVKM